MIMNKTLTKLKSGLVDFKNRLMDVLYKSEMVWTRLTLSCAEFIWAISLFWKGDTFERPTYNAMAVVLSEHTWGVIFLVTAILQFIIMIYKNLHHSPLGITFALYNSSLWWFVVVSMYLSVYPPPAGISGELALAFAAMWIFIRSGCGCKQKILKEKDKE
jgi:magnesium-transporting ATPase (P-type)